MISETHAELTVFTPGYWEKKIAEDDALESKLTDTISVVSAAREAVQLAESQGNTFGLELRNLSQGIRALEKDSHVPESNYGDALSVAMNAGAICVSIAVSTEEHTRGSATCQIYMPYSVKGALMPTRASLHPPDHPPNSYPYHNQVVRNPTLLSSSLPRTALQDTLHFFSGLCMQPDRRV